jgi:hypothetical protein
MSCVEYTNFPKFGRPLFKYKDDFEHDEKVTFYDCVLLVSFGQHQVNTKIESILCNNIYELDTLEFNKDGHTFWYEMLKKDVELGGENSRLI